MRDAGISEQLAGYSGARDLLLPALLLHTPTSHLVPHQLSPSYEQFAAALADSAAARAETERYKSKVNSMEKNIALLVAQLQSRMPDI